jgi:transketolase
MDIRDAFFDPICAAGERDPDFVIITNDMDVFALQRFKEMHPDRFINIGVAEQNMVNVAAGLAACGKRVLLFGISSFVTFRCFEQIKFNICSMNLPVVIAGVGSGFSFAFDGPTHHGTQDVAVMRALPEMTIFNPGDTVGAAACAQLALAARTPVYVRVDKGAFPALHDPKNRFEAGFLILRPLAETNLASTGYMTPIAVEVADSLALNGFRVGVVDVFRLKPLSGELVRDVFEKSRWIVTMEEHAISGGLGTAVSEVVADRGLALRLLRLGAADQQVLRYGSREWQLAREGLSVSMICQKIMKQLGTT